MLSKRASLQAVLATLLLACSFFVSAANLPDFTQLVEKAAPAVVNISTTQKVQKRSTRIPQEVPEIFRHFFGELPEGFEQGPSQQQRQSLGSGFIISDDGYILTNNHVIENADEIVVRLSDRRELVAELVGSDASSDLALLKIDAQDLPLVTMGNSDQLKVGEWVLAIGSPFGFDHSVTAGIVSAKGRSLPNETYVPFIQTDVAINPGNSGGPLFNLDGEVVGINSQIYTRSGGFMGLSFAIPMQVALEVAEQLKDQGRVSRGWLGVAIQDVNRDLAESFGLKKPQGALVANVDPDGPGAKGGLKAGDIILQVNEQTINTSSDLPPAVGRIRPNAKGKFLVLRNGSRKTLSIQVGERPDEMQLGLNSAAESEPILAGKLGLQVEIIPAGLKDKWSISNGVQVAEVSPEGAAAAAGIRRGDVLVSIASKDIVSPKQFAKLVENLATGQTVAVRLVRRGSPIFVALRVNE
ncbi:DegQ family serine endoprotease [Marinospirillum insulare]|uniref:Probable periplasmic serine endoprotease DegP-like n=1 Tax=Marinospirillum insulare TaxID=217169 RepID=A0ABQ5ZUF8_9GAMM|nr:DegQ family serine endoprotease [Marinospirillum insulare]GLR62682.1 serine protease MucD [Marinospirillum insulare]